LEERNFFSDQRRGNLNDVGIAEMFNVNITLRYRNEIRIYDPRDERAIRSRFISRDQENYPGKLLSENCF